MILFKNIFKYIFFFISLYFVITFFTTSLVNINKHTTKFGKFSLSEHKEHVLGHMNYPFISKYTKHLPKNIMPLTIYSNHYGDLYGLSMLLDGYRHKLNKDLIFFNAYDQILKYSEGSDLNCKSKYKNQTTSKSCRLPENYILTGIKLNNVSRKLFNENQVKLKCNEVPLLKINLKQKYLLDDTSGEKNLYLKFPYKNGVFQVISHEECNGIIEIKINNVTSNIDLELTGYTKYTAKGDPLDKDRLLKHYILLWNPKDVRDYMAISPKLFKEIENKELIVSQDIENILFLIN